MYTFFYIIFLCICLNAIKIFRPIPDFKVDVNTYFDFKLYSDLFDDPRDVKYFRLNNIPEFINSETTTSPILISSEKDSHDPTEIRLVSGEYNLWLEYVWLTDGGSLHYNKPYTERYTYKVNSSRSLLIQYHKVFIASNVSVLIFDCFDLCTLVSSIPITGGHCLAVSKMTKYMYVCTDHSFDIYNIMDLSNPELLGSFFVEKPNKVAIPFVYSNSNAYITSNHDLISLDISNPSSIRELKRVTFDNTAIAYDLALLNDNQNLLIAAGTKGLIIYSVYQLRYIKTFLPSNANVTSVTSGISYDHIALLANNNYLIFLFLGMANDPVYAGNFSDPSIFHNVNDISSPLGKNTFINYLSYGSELQTIGFDFACPKISFYASEDLIGSYRLYVYGSEPYTSVSFSISIGWFPRANHIIPNQHAYIDSYFFYIIPSDYFSIAGGKQLTFTSSLCSNLSLPIWINFNNLTFFGTPSDDDTDICIKITATFGTESVSSHFMIFLHHSLSLLGEVPIIYLQSGLPSISFSLPNLFLDIDSNLLSYQLVSKDDHFAQNLINITTEFTLKDVNVMIPQLQVVKIRIYGDFAYVLHQDGLTIYNVTCPFLPAFLSSIDFPREKYCTYSHDFVVGNNVIFISYYNGLLVVDISDVFHPSIISSTIGYFYCPETLTLLDTTLIVGETFFPSFTVDVKDPSHIQYIADTKTQFHGPIALSNDNNDIACVASSSFFYTFDVSNTSYPTEMAFIYLSGNIYHLEIHSNIVYILSKSDNLGCTIFFINITDPEKPEKIYSDESFKNITNLHIVSDNILMLSGYEKIYVLDISNPLYPFRLPDITTSFSKNLKIEFLAMKRDAIFFATSKNELSKIYVGRLDQSQPSVMLCTPTSQKNYEFSLIAKNIFNSSISCPLIISVNDSPIVIHHIPDQHAYIATLFNYIIHKDVFSGKSLFFHANVYPNQPLPSWISFNTSALSFSGIPNEVGSYHIVITALSEIWVWVALLLLI